MVVGLDWGPVAVWAGAAASFIAALVAVMVALGWFDSMRAPSIELTFEDAEPWCRRANLDGRDLLWVRVGVANRGQRTARGCVGRVIAVSTDGAARRDIDPIQLRRAGVPRSMSFVPVDLRRGQREFLNVLFLDDGDRWHIATFEDPDFGPGFPTELAALQENVLEVAVFADNADTATCRLVANRAPSRDAPRLRLAANA
jgi:hypothetical protein